VPSRRGWALASLAIAPLAAGCLGGGGSAATSQATLSRAEFTSRADQVCESYTKKISSLPVPSDLAGLAQQGERAVGLEQQELEELRALRPPPEQADQVDQMLDAIEQAIGDGHDLIDAARVGKRRAVNDAVTSLQGHLETANEVAKQLDLGSCAITG
jgi:hypothetical protein